MLSNQTFVRRHCGVESTPKRRVEFLNEARCWECFLKHCREIKERRLAVAKVVSRLPDSPERDYVLGMLK